MNLSPTRLCSAFKDKKLIAQGALVDVALTVKELLGDAAITALILNDATSEVIEVDFRGDSAAIVQRLNSRATASESTAQPSETQQPAARQKKGGRGRPKLGVVAREVTLLPKHWEWLNQQPGGASVALRLLVTHAQRDSQDKDKQRQAQTATYRFMTIMAGDLEEYEEALRALYAGDQPKFADLIGNWPNDIRSHTEKLAANAFA